MLRPQLLLLFLISSLSLFAQESTCNCLENLTQTIKKTGENYAGYPAKVIPATAKRYTALTRLLKKKAVATTNAKACY